MLIRGGRVTRAPLLPLFITWRAGRIKVTEIGRARGSVSNGRRPVGPRHFHIVMSRILSGPADIMR